MADASKRKRAVYPICLVSAALLTYLFCLSQTPVETTAAAGNASLKTGLVRHHQDTTPPIGAIIAWHKNFAGVPQELPTGCVECNGQPIAYGPLAGKELPKLNEERRFLRGGTESGSLEADQFLTHQHGLSGDGSHGHSMEACSTGPLNRPLNKAPVGSFHYSGFAQKQKEGEVFTPDRWPTHGYVSGTGHDSKHAHTVTDTTIDGNTEASRVGTETRPINMSVVWIMRIE